MNCLIKKGLQIHISTTISGNLCHQSITFFSGLNKFFLILPSIDSRTRLKKWYWTLTHPFSWWPQCQHCHYSYAMCQTEAVAPKMIQYMLTACATRNLKTIHFSKTLHSFSTWQYIIRELHKTNVWVHYLFLCSSTTDLRSIYLAQPTTSMD